MTEIEIHHGVATILVNREPTCTFDVPPGVSTIQINGVAIDPRGLFCYWNIDAWRIQSEMWSKELTRRFKLVMEEAGLI